MEHAEQIKKPIYLDHHSTTPIDPQVLQAMMPYLTEHYGNPASRHLFGGIAEEAVERAREEVAALIGARPEEIIFTSGATEADNLAIKGVAWANRERGNHLITCRTEHHAVLDCGRVLEKQGFEVTYLDVDRYGLVDPEAVAAAITERTILISLMYANNEVGTIHPVGEIAHLAQERGVLFHCDAVQAIGKVPVRVDRWPVDLVSISAHKMYGPKGVGALYIRKKRPRLKITPLIDGGGHERKLRSGTLNVPAIVGFGKACSIAGQVMTAERVRLKTLRDRLYQRITTGLDGVFLNGHPEERLPGNLNLCFAFIEGGSLLLSLDDVALSSGSACTSSTSEPPYVLLAMGVDPELARSAIRFGLGRGNTEQEIDYVAARLIEEATKLRALSPAYRMRTPIVEGLL